jgi:hypothetical protein
MYAVFPLNIVVLPEESVALHLFEPRYRQLFKDHREGSEFVILHQKKGVRAIYGTLVYIDKIVNEFPDETVDVIVKGSSIVKINSFMDKYPGKLYSAVEVKIKEVDAHVSDELFNEFEGFLQGSQKRMVKSHCNSLFYIANRLELDTASKIELISLNDTKKMNTYLLNHMRMMKKIKEQEEQLNMNFYLN